MASAQVVETSCGQQGTKSTTTATRRSSPPKGGVGGSSHNIHPHYCNHFVTTGFQPFKYGKAVVVPQEWHWLERWLILGRNLSSSADFFQKTLNRGYYMAARRYEISLRVLEKYFTSERRVPTEYAARAARLFMLF